MKATKKKSSTRKTTASSSKKTIILAIDGGGIKGLVPAMILEHIEKGLGKACYQTFDIIGGTSTGGILSTGLTTRNNNNSAKDNTPYKASDIVKIYKNDGGQIFLKQGAGRLYNYAKYFSAHNGRGIEPFMQGMLKSDRRLSDAMSETRRLPNARVKQMFTTCYTVNRTGVATPNPTRAAGDFGPYLFNWVDAAASKSKQDYFVWEAARGTSAAPTYFPIAEVGGGGTNPGGGASRSQAQRKWVVDGGMMSNNPAIWGLSEAFRLDSSLEMKDIIMISIGTGLYPGNAGVGIHNNYSRHGISTDDGNWGPYEWMNGGYLADASMLNLEGVAESGPLLTNVILDAVQLASHTQLKQMTATGLQYYRLEPIFDKAVQMDDISSANLSYLETQATNYIKNEATTLTEIIKLLKKS